MRVLSTNRYDYAADLVLIEDDFNTKVYLEDIAGFSKDLLTVLKKITANNTITSYIANKVNTYSMSNTSYLYLKDIIKMLDTTETINLSKYKDVLFSKTGRKQEPIKNTINRNIETEFVILISKLDIVGMLDLLKTLSTFDTESNKGQ